MKTPDEIKKGLECCHSTDVCECEECPYSVDGEETMNCDILLSEDANEYIRRLEERNTWHESNEKYLAWFMKDLSRQIEQLEAERDAAVADLMVIQECSTCKYDPDDPMEDRPNVCYECCTTKCNYEWRGVQKED